MILGIVPARGGSRRVPGKNVRRLGGIPLVVRAANSALRALSLDMVCVSSDDDEILSLFDNTDVVRIRRPAALSTDLSPAIDYVRHAIDVVENMGSVVQVSEVVIVQPSSPFTTCDDIDATVALLNNTGADSAVSVVRVAHDVHPRKFKVMSGDRLNPYLEDEGQAASFDDLPAVYVRNCSVYATRRNIVESGAIIGRDCRGYEMPRERSLDINDELDWEMAVFMEQRMAAATPGLSLVKSG
jgi:CMP-N,N'-diacetyllegionaminic acid synthase